MYVGQLQFSSNSRRVRSDRRTRERGTSLCPTADLVTPAAEERRQWERKGSTAVSCYYFEESVSNH